MQAYVGEPPRGKWEHPGLRGAFLRKLVEAGVPPENCRSLRKELRFSYDARIEADYSSGEIDKETAENSLCIARKVIRLVKEVLRE